MSVVTADNPIETKITIEWNKPGMTLKTKAESIIERASNCDDHKVSFCFSGHFVVMEVTGPFYDTDLIVSKTRQFIGFETTSGGQRFLETNNGPKQWARV